MKRTKKNGNERCYNGLVKLLESCFINFDDERTLEKCKFIINFEQSYDTRFARFRGKCNEEGCSQ